MGKSLRQNFDSRMHLVPTDKSRKSGDARPAEQPNAPHPVSHSTALLAAIVAGSDDAIISKDLNGVVTSWNEAAGKMFGYSSDEMVGQSILRIIPEDLHHEEALILSRLRAGEKIDHYETTRISRDGQLLDVSVTISPIRDGSGTIIGASKIARDISERKKMQRLVIRAEKLAASGRLAATVAHEINNPLEAAVNLIYLSRRLSAPEDKIQEYLTAAESELQLVSEIARRTLGCYQEAAPLVSLHLHDLMEEVLHGYQSRLRSCRIAVDCRYHDPRKIAVSREEFLQVFSNVIANAIDAMSLGGTLRIEAEEKDAPQGRGISVAIRDNGAGIAREYRDRVFEPFFTTRGNLAGGIGLWIARELVERRRGTITLTSSTEVGNHGTQVCIFVPFEIAGLQS